MSDHTELPFKKFILFAHDDRGAGGGLLDIACSFDTFGEALEVASEMAEEHRYIIDRDTRKTLDVLKSPLMSRRLQAARCTPVNQRTTP